MADFKSCSYAVRVAASVARRRKGSGEIFPSVALVEQISSLLSPEKAAEGETLRHMSRTTTTHAYHLPVQNPARAGARGAGGGVSTPAKTHRFCNSPFCFEEKSDNLFSVDEYHFDMSQIVNY